MKVAVLYGTESGNCELIAEDLGAKLRDAHEVEVSDLRDYAPDRINASIFYIIVCSTHGEGGLPNTAVPFYEALNEVVPDITGVRYSMFGLGDTFYEETYSQGSEIIDRRLTELGALRVGEYGRHDASSWDIASDLALEWLPGVLDAAAVAPQPVA